MYKATEGAKKWMERKPYETAKNKEVNTAGEVPDCLLNLYESWELITPERAKDFLSSMDRNRSLRRGVVQRYKTDLLDQDFNICFDSPIIFNMSGEMVNGQHRCMAAVETERSFWCKVYRNVPDDAVIDKGLTRSTGDALWMRGAIDNSALRSNRCISLIRAYLSAKGLKTDAITDTQIGEFINNYQEELITAMSITQKGGNGLIACKSGVMAAVFAALVCGVSSNILYEMMEITNSGFMHNEAESSAIVLRNHLLDYDPSGGSAIKDLTLTTDSAIYDFIHGIPRKKKYTKPKSFYIDMCPAMIPQDIGR